MGQSVTRQHQEVMETSKFPEIRYDADAIAVAPLSEMLFSATLDGRLTLHGVTPQPACDSARLIVGEYA